MRLNEPLPDRPTFANLSSHRKRLRLALCILAIGLVWLIALPWLAETTPIQRHIAEQQRQGIDPSALFYSELEILPPIAHRYERLHDSHGNALWGRRSPGAAARP